MICSFVGSLIQDNLMYIGTKNGEVRLIDIEKGKAYKTLNCCNNAIIEMLVIERKSKPGNYIILFRTTNNFMLAVKVIEHKDDKLLKWKS